MDSGRNRTVLLKKMVKEWRKSERESTDRDVLLVREMENMGMDIAREERKGREREKEREKEKKKKKRSSFFLAMLVVAIHQ